MDWPVVRQVVVALGLAAALAPPTPALADDGAPAGPAYAVSCRLSLAPAAAAAVHRHYGSAGANLPAPPVPSVTVPLGEQTRQAYALALLRLCLPAGQAGPDLTLEVTEVSGGATVDALGWRAEVDHQLVVRAAAAAAEPLARLTVHGAARLPGGGPGALTVAFSRAAAAAAAQLEYQLEAQPAVATWLGDRGVPLLGDRRTAPQELPRASALQPQPPFERAATATFLEVALGSLDGGSGRSFGLGARGGVRSGPVLLQLTVQQWAPYTTGGAMIDYQATALGFEAGLTARLGPAISVRAGVGPQAVLVHGSQRWGVPANEPAVRFSISRVELAGFAALDYAVALGSGGAGVRFGVEGRWLGGSAVAITGYPASVEVGGSGVWLVIGGEWPTAWWPPRG